MIIFKFSLLDWIVLAILLYSVVVSWFKGFVREVLGLITVLAAALISAWFYRDVGNLFKDVARTENLALFFGFSVTFLVVLIAGFVTIWLITKFMKFAKLEWADRLLGAAFGIQTERLKNSELAPYFLAGSRVIAIMTPFEMKAKFLVGYRTLERLWR